MDFFPLAARYGQLENAGTSWISQSSLRHCSAVQSEIKTVPVCGQLLLAGSATLRRVHAVASLPPSDSRCILCRPFASPQAKAEETEEDKRDRELNAALERTTREERAAVQRPPAHRTRARLKFWVSESVWGCRESGRALRDSSALERSEVKRKHEKAKKEAMRAKASLGTFATEQNEPDLFQARDLGFKALEDAPAPDLTDESESEEEDAGVRADADLRGQLKSRCRLR